MPVPTQDPNLLTECLDRFIAGTESRSLADQANVLAERLNAMSPASEDAIVEAQLFLQKRGIECSESSNH